MSSKSIKETRACECPFIIMKLNKGLRPPHRGCDCPACAEYHAKHGGYAINFKPYPAFRYRSLIGGFHNVSEKHNFFSFPDCDIILGCSRAKVEATQHYLEALQLIRHATLFETLPETQTCQQKDNLVPTLFGDYLLNRESGRDPYLESPDSLYLLHYHLTTSPMDLACYYLFNCFVPMSGYFSRDEATDSFEKWLAERTEKPPAKNTIRQHINTVLRTYAAETEGMDIEDWAELLFVDLNLIGCAVFDRLDGKKEERFYFNDRENKSELGLSTEVFGYALLSFWDTRAPHSATLDLKTLLWEAGSPLMVFKLTENQFMDYITQLEDLTGKAIEHRFSTNLKQLYRTKPIEALDFLKR